MSATPALPEGYEVMRLLGHGAFGAVYQARQVALDRLVAVKVVLDATHVDVGRFLREGQAVSKLRHPAIVQVYAVDTLPGTGQPFLVFEWVDGGELKKEMAAGPLPGARVLEVFRLLLEGLEHAHGQGVLHRDIKPANLLVPRAGGLKIADFGLARLHESRDKLTRTGAVMGTPTYMSPEQALGKGVDAASDLYSAGVMFYEMLAGGAPFAGGRPLDVLQMQISQVPPPLSTRVTGVPAAVAKVVEGLLAKDPRARPQSARDVLTALEGVTDADVAGLVRPGARVTGKTPALPSRPTGGRTGKTALRSMSSAGLSGTTLGVAATAPPRSRAMLGAAVACALAVVGALGVVVMKRKPAGEVPVVATSPAEELAVEALPPRGARVRASVGPVRVRALGQSAEPRTFALSADRSVVVTGLAPGGRYLVSAGGADVELDMPVPLKHVFVPRIGSRSVVLLLRFSGDEGMPLAARVVDAKTDREVWKSADGLACRPRVRVSITGLEPDRYYRVDWTAGKPGAYITSWYTHTLPARMGEDAAAVLARLERGGPGTADTKLLIHGVGEEHVSQLVKLLGRVPPLQGETLYEVTRSLAEQMDERHLELMRASRKQFDDRRGTACLAALKTPVAFKELQQWPEPPPMATAALLADGDDIAWGLWMADPQRAVPYFAGLTREHFERAARPQIARMSVAAAGFRTRDARLLPKLGELARGDEDDIAREALRSVGRVGGEPARRLLRELLAERRVRPALVPTLLRSLALVEKRGTYDAFLPFLRSADPACAAMAAHAVGQLGGTETDAQLAPLLAATDARVVGAAAWALARHPGPDTAKLLRARLAVDGRGRVARALGFLGDTAALPSLRKLAGEEDRKRVYDRAEAVWALGRLGDRESADAILKIFETSKNDIVRFRAFEALAAMDPERARKLQPPQGTRLGREYWLALSYAHTPPAGARTVLVDAAFPERDVLETMHGDQLFFAVYGVWNSEFDPAQEASFTRCLGTDDGGVQPSRYDIRSGMFTWTWPDDGPFSSVFADCPCASQGSGPVTLAAHPGNVDDANGAGFVTVHLSTFAPGAVWRPSNY